MYTSQFEKARVLLAEPNIEVRRQVADMLLANGFKEIIQTGNMAGVIDGLNNNDIDVLIADTAMPEGDLSEVIWKLRHREVGTNPFTVVITLITARTAEVISRAVNAGADDVLLKPVDTAVLFERIKAMVRGRKRFVVTSDYIGPDRRSQDRGTGEQIAQIRVPNPLEMRTSGGMASKDMRRVIDQAYSLINQEKVNRHVHQLDWLAVRLQPKLEGTAPLAAETFQVYLDRLRAVSIDLTQRIRTTPLSHLSALCMTLERVARECAQDPTSTDKGRWNLLLRLLDSLPRACDPERGGIAPKAVQAATATGISPLLDKPTGDGQTFGPGGRFTRSA